MTPKTAPWFVHYGCVPGPCPDDRFVVTTSILKPTQTHFIAGPLALTGGHATMTILFDTYEVNIWTLIGEKKKIKMIFMIRNHNIHLYSHFNIINGI